MRLSTFFVLATAAICSIATPFEEQAACSCAKKKAAMNAELKTIGSHSAADAAKIPLDPLATRSFYVT